MLPRNIILYGKDEPLPEQINLQAGPLNLIYEQGDLRYINFGEREFLRRIYVAVRDRNWGTIPPTFSNVHMDITRESFYIHYDVENMQGEIDFAWSGEIIGNANGTIQFNMDGIARSSFLRNRIGFCILHPASSAGENFFVEHVDGSIENGLLPVIISSNQPVQPFSDMRSMACQIVPGILAKLSFSGDIYEMEDQRNWTDASFKTFCTPLRIPYPVKILKNTRITQSVILSLQEERKIEERSILEVKQPENSRLTFKLQIDSPAVPLPKIGLGAASHGQLLSDLDQMLINTLHLHHLRLDLSLSDPGYPDRIRRVSQEAKALDVLLEIALLISENGEDELRQFAQLLKQIRPLVCTWLIYPTKEKLNGGSPIEEVVKLARKHLAGYGSGVQYGSGTNTDFIFLQRTPPPRKLLDLVCFAINPQAHSFDNSSIVETLQAQGAAVESARLLTAGLPVYVSPVTLKPRFNPYATGPAPEIHSGELPPQVDVRQMSLFGAAWTAGSLKYLAESGADSITYYETTGWRGVMETRDGSPLQDRFYSQPGSVFPLYHVLADIGEFAGGSAIRTSSSDKSRVDGFAVQKDSKIRIVLANFTNEAQCVSLERISHPVKVRYLDEENAEESMYSPEHYRSVKGETLLPSAEKLRLDLKPYGIARIDTLCLVP